MIKVLKKAFRLTLPVLFGYLVLGMGFGLLLEELGYNFVWAFFISLFIYAGSMQYLLVGFLKTGIDLLSVAVMTLTVNSRMIFYGLSFLEKFEKMGKAKWYMIFSLTDETYSLLSMLETPKDMDENKLMLAIAALDHSYWIIGSVLGAVAGQLITFNRAGVEFSMTALFVVIFLDQWKAYKSHLPVFVAIVCGVVSLIIFGGILGKADSFIAPALISTVFILLMLRPKITKELELDATEEVVKNAH